MFILVVCLAGVFCLTPLTIYLLWLLTLNRRTHPAVVSGHWDFVALLGGLSGFGIFGGGLLLSLLQSNVRYWLRGNFEALRDAWDQDRMTWFAVVGVYLIMVVGGAGRALLSRLRTLVVYNVDPAQFELILTEVFDQIGRPVERRGNLWLAGVPLFEAEPFEAGRTVAVRWLSDDIRLYQEIERLVREAVLSLPGGAGPTARWLLSAVGSSAVFVALCLLLLLYSLALIR